MQQPHKRVLYTMLIISLNKMNNPPPINILSKIIRDEFARQEIVVTSVYLFGSRAKGTAKSESDWDFLIIIRDKISPSLKRKIISGIRKLFIFDYNIDADFIVLEKKDVFLGSTDKGRISYYALREGLPV